MKTSFKNLLIIGSASLALVACDSGDKGDEKELTDQAAETSSTMDDMKDKVVEKAIELLKLDTSSLDSFKSSLSAMKGSLSSADASKLTSAITTLAKDSASSGGGILDAAKSVAGGASVEETVYKAMGDKLDGMTFDDVMKLVD